MPQDNKCANPIVAAIEKGLYEKSDIRFEEYDLHVNNVLVGVISLDLDMKCILNSSSNNEVIQNDKVLSQHRENHEPHLNLRKQGKYLFDKFSTSKSDVMSIKQNYAGNMRNDVFVLFRYYC